MQTWKMIEKVIDVLMEIMGKIGWILVLYCMIFGVTDVFLRYVLNAPSLWIGTTIQAAMVLMACFGGAYALNHNSFVKLDLFYARFSERKKAICDIITVVYTFLFVGVLVWKGYQAAMLSIKLKQVTPTGVPIPIYPIKTIIPIAGVLVLLVVIKKLVNDILIVMSPKNGEEQ
ncbi:TRAP transporter small permease subunit [Desulforhopalus singaporensis]|uniref:TRAP-type mannitol/chloroaromatic compound transport system, small permease component n=1 Tax=Desulforhopalus singaporensis TaxID=91360 RepID=A0A1H0UM68_9BACT|nr:TRAP transporter small permease subunit [Desulforhopalus singaporensis]SDP66936.1 TRAP-type mannitol/chloroaromatic compound transport system, small permease component [Desulforhopalus singaporensis]